MIMLNKSYRETARQAILRLMKDALELNDKQNVDDEVRKQVEEDILEDVQAIFDYIVYIEKAENNGNSSEENSC